MKLSAVLATFAIAGSIATFPDIAVRADSTPVATFGDQVITQDDYFSALDAQYGKNVMPILVYSRLVLNAAAKAKVLPTESDIDTAIALERRLNPAKVADPNDVAGMKQMREDVRASLALRNLRTQGIVVSDADAQTYYNDHMKDFTLPAKVESRLVVSDDLPNAQLAEGELKGAMTPADIAAKQGQHVPGFNGYDLNLLKAPGAERNEFYAALARMRTGDIHTEEIGGKYITVQLIRNEPGRVPPFDEIKSDVILAAKMAKAPSSQEVLIGLYKAANVQFKDDKYKAYFINPPTIGASEEAHTGAQ